VVQAAFAAWLLSGTGCSLALKTDSEQCTVDADCKARGAAFANTVCTANVCVANDPKWGCIGKVTPLKSGAMTMFSVHLIDLISSKPVTANLAVNLCSKYDPTCSASTALSTLTVDSTGTVSTTVASDFEGYLDVVDTSGTYFEILIFIDLAVIDQNGTILLIPKAAQPAVAAAAGVTVDPNAGILFVGTADCTGARSAGVGVGLVPHGSETVFYLQNKSPVTSATMTDPDGNAGFVNVAPGTVTVTGTVAEANQELGKVTALVRQGTTTFIMVRPTPTL
jgi:hypothetical protein